MVGDDFANDIIINSIYPDDTNIDEYKLTEKQIVSLCVSNSAPPF